MQKRYAIVTSAALLMLAGKIWAGGFYLQLGNPDASEEARKAGAAVTVQVAGCHDPAAAQVRGTAVGEVNGRRQEITLRLEKLSKPGMYALTQQWPKEGKWVIRLAGRVDDLSTFVIVGAGEKGVDRLHAKAEHRAFTNAEVEAMLRALP